MKIPFLLLIVCFWLPSCSQQTATPTSPSTLLLGSDMSYTNEMEDCGGKYRQKGAEIDPFVLMKAQGATIVRFRLWHTPNWTTYSTLKDVKKSIKRAKKEGLKILLDFHYSDTWADPAHQQIPKAWEAIKETKVLGDSVYQYTLNTLLTLDKEGLSPDIVQVGNEINSEILQYTANSKNNIDWPRNVFLLNKGLEAVKKAAQISSKNIATMLHIAQPENAIGWFTEAQKNNIETFDWIGLSYYAKWSKYDFTQLAATISNLKSAFQKKVMIVETAYPYTTQNADNAPNILNEGIATYPVSPEGQLKYMTDLTQTTLNAGGEGVIYWESHWISTSCKTLWVTGSSWDNATFFDAANRNEALPVLQFLNTKNYVIK